MNSLQARQISIVHLLRKWQLKPVRFTHNRRDWWYFSPFRQEKKASFQINTHKNLWYDFGLSQGGSAVDLVIAYKKYNLKEALAYLKHIFRDPENVAFKNDFEDISKQNLDSRVGEGQKNRNIAEVVAIRHPALIEYLAERKIPLALAQKYIQEIHYTADEKPYFALGMKNQAGGYEIRNKYFKSSLLAKNFSLIKGGNESESSISVFEGMFDFLSCLAYAKKSELKGDVLILHSLAFGEKALKFIDSQTYERVFTFFDHDQAGMAMKERFGYLGAPIRHLDKLYAGYKDFNEYWTADFPLVSS